MKLSANELRIGNYIYHTELKKKTHYVVNLSLLQEISLFDDAHDFKPIPLTEEWLLKFGFDNDGFYKTYRIKLEDFYYNSVHYTDNKWVYSDDESDAACHTITYIKYVHQLQNLYFALTEKELTIN